MSEQLLQQILNELKEMKADQKAMRQDVELVKSQLKETRQDVELINSQLNELRSDQKETQQDVELIKSQLNELKSDQKETRQDVELIKSQLNELKSDQKETRQDIALLKSQIKENTALIRAIRDRQEETDAKLEALTMDVHKLNGFVTEHAGKLDHIVKSQERQDKILESLALRSLEQESELRELKRIK